VVSSLNAEPSHKKNRTGLPYAGFLKLVPKAGLDKSAGSRFGRAAARPQGAAQGSAASAGTASRAGSTGNKKPAQELPYAGFFKLVPKAGLDHFVGNEVERATARPKGGRHGRRPSTGFESGKEVQNKKPAVKSSTAGFS
jgi:hypothetical protein